MGCSVILVLGKVLKYRSGGQGAGSPEGQPLISNLPANTVGNTVRDYEETELT